MCRSATDSSILNDLSNTPINANDVLSKADLVQQIINLTGKAIVDTNIIVFNPNLYELISGNITASESDYLPQLVIAASAFENISSSKFNIFERTGYSLIKRISF